MSETESGGRAPCVVCGDAFPLTQMSESGSGHICFSCDAARAISRKNDQAQRAESKRARRRGRRIPTNVALAVIACCVAVMLLQFMLRPDFDVPYELDTSNPLLLGDHCLGLLSYHINEERFIDRSQVDLACPPPLVISERGPAIIVAAPQPFAYGFSEIQVVRDPLSMEVVAVSPLAVE